MLPVFRRRVGQSGVRGRFGEDGCGLLDPCPLVCRLLPLSRRVALSDTAAAVAAGALKAHAVVPDARTFGAVLAARAK